MGIAERLASLDRVTGGVNAYPDYQAVTNTVLQGGPPIAAQGLPLPSAYQNRTPSDVVGRYGFMAQAANTPLTGDQFTQFRSDWVGSRLAGQSQAIQTAGQQLQQQHSGGGGGILGSVLHGLGDVASAVTKPLSWGMDAMRWAYTNMVSQPLSTFIILGSDGSQWKGASTHGWNSWAKFLHPENWSKAYDMAQHTSPGQAMVNMLGTDDIFDQVQVTKTVNSDWYHMATGALDALVNVRMDPTQIAAGGLSNWSKIARFTPEAFGDASKAMEIAQAKGALAKISDHIDQTIADARKAFPAPAEAQVASKLSGEPAIARLAEVPQMTAQEVNARNLAAARFRDERLPNVLNGDTIAANLYNADNVEQRSLYLSALAGDMNALEPLKDLRADLTSRMQFFQKETGYLDRLSGPYKSLRDFTIHNLADTKLEGLGAEVKRLEDQANFIDKLIPGSATSSGKEGTLFGELASHGLPVDTLMSRIKSGVNGSALFQSSPFQAAVRVVSSPIPQNFLDLSHAGSDTRFDNLLRYMGEHSEQERNTLRGQWMAGDVTSRFALADQAQKEALSRIAAKNGITPDEVKAFGSSMDASQQAAMDALRLHHGEAYGLVRDPDSGVINMIQSPILQTQLSDIALVPDWHGIRSAMSDWGQRKAANPFLHLTFDGSHEVANRIMSAWRPLVLLTPRIAIRNMLLDESLFNLAKIHSVSDLLYAGHVYGTQLKNLAEGYSESLGLNAGAAIRKAAHDKGIWDPDLVANSAHLLENGVDAAAITASTKRRAAAVGVLTGSTLGYLGGDIPGAAIGGIAGGVLGKTVAGMSRAGLPSLDFSDHNIMAAIPDDPEMSRQLLNELHNPHAMVSVLNDQTVANKTKIMGSGSWKAATAGDPEWDMGIERALNLQYGQDFVGRKLLTGDTPSEVAMWLAYDPAGRAYMRSIPFKADHVGDYYYAKQYAEQLSDQVETLTMGNKAIKDAALDGKVSAKFVRSTVDSAAELPPVHAEAIMQSLGKSKTQLGLKEAIDKFYQYVNARPTSELSRVPAFAMTYRAEMQNRIAALGATQLTEDELSAVEHAARGAALHEVRRNFYNYADQTDLHAILRNMVPFLPATQDAIERFARIGIDNPVFARHVTQAWQGLDNSLVSAKDQDGHPTLRFRIPDFAKGLINHSPLFRNAFDDAGYLSIDKHSLNMITGQGIGFGPIIQFAASKLVQSKPELEDSLKMVIPYGPNTGLGLGGVFDPTMFKAARAVGGEETSRSFLNATQLVMRARLAKMQLGEEAQVDFNNQEAVDAFVNQTKKEARALYSLTRTANLFSPGQLSVLSPFQLQMEQYQKIRAAHPQNADAIFWDQMGAEFMKLYDRVHGDGLDATRLTPQQEAEVAQRIAADPQASKYADAMYWLTSRVSKSNEGLPATEAAFHARQQFGKLIDAYPEIAPFIVGTQGMGEGEQFSHAVYAHQLATDSGNTGQKQRTTMTPGQSFRDVETNKGWMEFGRIQDLIDAELISRAQLGGSGDINDRRNQDLATAKRGAKEQIGQRYPSWWQEYNMRDDTKFQRRIDGFKAVLKSSLMDQTKRPELGYLSQYLTARDEVTAELARRQQAGLASTLTAKGNADLYNAWQALVGQLKEQSTDFSALYNRWLERDPVALNPLDQQVAA